jgi:ankyrin repeat protein
MSQNGDESSGDEEKVEPEMDPDWIALCNAAQSGNLKAVRLLIQQGVDKDKAGGLVGLTPLVAAALKGHLGVVRYLVQRGADMEKADNGGLTPLLVAAANGQWCNTWFSEEPTRRRPMLMARLPSLLQLITVNWRW